MATYTDNTKPLRHVLPWRCPTCTRKVNLEKCVYCEVTPAAEREPLRGEGRKPMSRLSGGVLVSLMSF